MPGIGGELLEDPPPPPPPPPAGERSREWSLDLCRVAVFQPMIRPAGLFAADVEAGLADLVSEYAIRNREGFQPFPSIQRPVGIGSRDNGINYKLGGCVWEDSSAGLPGHLLGQGSRRIEYPDRRRWQPGDRARTHRRGRR